jgi:hypothetical protein
LQVERLAAVDALNVTDRVWHNHVGNPACTASHRLAWREAKRRGAEAVLVFEDDVILGPNFRERIAALEVQDDWDIVQFGCTFVVAPEYLGGGVVKMKGQSWDWHAMLIHSRVWPRLHKLMSTQDLLREVWKTYPTPHITGHEEAGFKPALMANPSLRQRVFAMPVRNLNSHPPLDDWGVTDPVLHFLQIKEPRVKLIADAWTMARERNGGSELRSFSSTKKSGREAP